jgi:hypothetical protein
MTKCFQKLCPLRRIRALPFAFWLSMATPENNKYVTMNLRGNKQEVMKQKELWIWQIWSVQRIRREVNATWNRYRWIVEFCALLLLLKTYKQNYLCTKREVGLNQTMYQTVPNNSPITMYRSNILVNQQGFVHLFSVLILLVPSSGQVMTDESSYFRYWEGKKRSEEYKPVCIICFLLLPNSIIRQIQLICAAGTGLDIF